MLEQLEQEIRELIKVCRKAPYANAGELMQVLDRLLQQPITRQSIELVQAYLTGQLGDGQRLTYCEDLCSLEYTKWPEMMDYLYRANALTYDLFRTSSLRAPRAFYSLNNAHWSRYEWLATHYRGKFGDSCYETLLHYSNDLGWELAQEFSEPSLEVLRGISFLSGSKYLLLAADYHQRYQLGKLVKGRTYNIMQRELIHLAQAYDAMPTDESAKQAVVEKLKEYPPESLKALLPFAKHGYVLVCEALGWQQVIPLVLGMAAIANRVFDVEGYNPWDIPNAADPESGVINVREMQNALLQAGEPLAREVLRLFFEAKSGLENTTVLMEALGGWNRIKVTKGFKRDHQLSVKAYGLLPLEGEDDALERYLALKQSAKHAAKYGAQRRVTHSAAIQAALTNLAQLVGYGDADRLEWAMEANLAEEVSSDAKTWTIGDYCLTLNVDGTDIDIQSSRGGRALKTVPAKVKTSPEYEEAKEAVARFRSQVSRIRNRVESLMCSGEALDPDDFRQFIRLPAAQAILQAMILRLPDDVFGLFQKDLMVIEDLSGTQHSVDKPIVIAHPYHLFQAGVLADWQRAIVHRRIVQPIRQAFRELYILTPAERETRLYSNRFAGQLVNPRIAAKLFSTRGWRMSNFSEGITPTKVFGQFRATFDFSGVYYHFGGTEPVTADRIYFESYPLANNGYAQPTNYIPLEEIPPLIFSEVMRTADLVVSVAQRDGEARVSSEIYERRGELIQALLEDLELPSVTVDGHFAYVSGKLAKYRVHLGSAAIHIEPGSYLCIVPENWGQRHDQLFLPFADGNDTKISEVISKILLLLADDRITDETILRQIRR